MIPIFGEVISHHRRSVSMEERIELMYRQPGLPEHQNITDVLDEIILTMRDINDRVTRIEIELNKLQTK